MTKLTEMTDGATLDGTELVLLSQHDTTVTMTETTISAVASDNSYNDSGSGFVTAGFAEGDTVVVSGFATGANNITTGVITALTAAKMTISGTDGDVITDEAAGESVTISKWVTKRKTSQDVANLSSFSVAYLDRVLMDGAVIDATLTTPPGGPSDGDAYIVPASATGDWASQDDKITIYETSAWVFYAPAEGYFLRDQTNDTTYQYDGSAWTEFTSGGGGSGDTFQQNLGMVLIGTYDLSVETLGTGNELDVDVSGYAAIEIGLSGGANASGDNVGVRFSADGGSTFRSTSGDYLMDFTNDTAKGLNSSRTDLQVGNSGSGTTAINGITSIIGLNQAASPVHAVGQIGSVSNTTNARQHSTNLEAVDTLRFLTSAGNNMTAGTLTIWGVPKQRTNEALGLVERTYTDTLTISAAASGTWSIPANCIWAAFSVADLEVSSSGAVDLQTELNKRSDGLAASFDISAFDYTAGDAGLSAAVSISSSTKADNSTGAYGAFGFDIELRNPRSSSQKTVQKSLVNSHGNNAANDEFRAQYAVAATAEDHDEIDFNVTAGNMTGTIQITYTVLEAEPGYQKLEFTTATAMTISQVPAMVESNLSGAATHTLPADAPVGTGVEFIEIGSFTTTVQCPTGGTLNGVSNGSATITAQYDVIRCRKVTGTDAWIITGDHGAVS